MAVDAQRAFSGAYKEHLGWMLRTVRRLGVPSSEEEDVAHDVFSTAWRRIDTWQPERPMRPWLFGIAFRVVSNRKQLKRGSVEEASEELDQQQGALPRPDEVMEGEAARRMVLQALESLPLEQRAVFVAADIDKTPVPELARELDLPLNTTYSRLRLARQRFQSTWDSLQKEVRA